VIPRNDPQGTEAPRPTALVLAPVDALATAVSPTDVVDTETIISAQLVELLLTLPYRRLAT
jgi:hypothetical protein